MKILIKSLLLFAFICSHLATFAQVPQVIPYQAVARGINGNLLRYTPISLRFSIRDGSASGSVIYSETHNPTTNILGLFSVNIGQGNVVSGTFSNINWGSGIKFIQVEMDPSGGTTYTDMGTQQMLSVPYAFVAGKSNDNNWTMSGNNIFNNNSGNVGVGSANPLMELHVSRPGDSLALFENTNNLGVGSTSSIYFKNGVFYTGAIKTIGDNSVMARLGFFTYALSSPTGLQERLSITDGGFVGIGTTTPSAKLDVVGRLRIFDNTQGAGKVLTSDANGLTSWQTPAADLGVTSVGPIAVSSSANGGVVTGSVLNLTPANQLNGGIVTSGNQEFGGSKTFLQDLHVNGLRVGRGGNNVDQSNTAIGFNAINNLTPGNENNTAVGYNAQINNYTGDGNTAVGANANGYNYYGSNNTAVGYNALISNETSDNTGVGYNANVNASAINATAIGCNAYAGASNSLVLGSISGVNGGTANTNVGIGTTTPAASLDVKNSSTTVDGIVTILANGIADPDFALTTRKGENSPFGGSISSKIGLYYSTTDNASIRFHRGSASTGGFMSFSTNTGTERMRIDGSGNVGINTTNPIATLHVVSRNTTYNTIPISYFNYGNGLQTISWTAAGTIAGYFQGNIVSTHSVITTNGSLTTSDLRLKKNFGRSNMTEDLHTLNMIKVTDYQYIDSLGLGTAMQKKVIAQELEAVYPNAVKYNSDYIPDIYTLSCDVSMNENKMIISIEKDHHLVKGDNVKWIDESGEVHFDTVSNIISERSFEIRASASYKRIFVWGKKVNDLRTVDYDALTMLNVSATQQLHKLICHLEEENKKLKDQNDTIKQQYNDLKSENNSFRSDIEKIKIQLGMDVKAEK